MITLKTFDVLLQNETEEFALEYARGLVWCELESTVQTLHDCFDLIDVIDGVGVYFNYNDGSYIFTDETDEEDD